MNPSRASRHETAPDAPPLPRPCPTYRVTAEGAEHEWHSPTITVAQVRALAGWDVSQAVVEVDLDSSTETMPETARPVTLRPGAEFARRVRFTQGIA